MLTAYPKTHGLVINPAIHRGDGGAIEFGSEPFQRFIGARPNQETVETVAVGSAHVLPAMNRGVND
jgi:hypothetical protein